MSASANRLRRSTDGSDEVVLTEEIFQEWTIEVRWLAGSYRVRCLPPGAVGYAEHTRGGFESVRVAREAGELYVSLAWSGMRVQPVA